MFETVVCDPTPLRIHGYFYMFCVRDKHKETQRKSQEGVTQGSLVMSHMFFIFTHILHTTDAQQPTYSALWSERGSQVLCLSVADGWGGGGGGGGVVLFTPRGFIYREFVIKTQELLWSGEQEKHQQCLFKAL